MRKNIIWISLFSFAMTTIAESSIASVNTGIFPLLAKNRKKAEPKDSVASDYKKLTGRDSVALKGIANIIKKNGSFYLEFPTRLLGREFLVTNRLQKVPLELNEAGVNKGINYENQVVYNPQNEKMQVSETKGLKNPQIPKTKRLLFIQTHKRQRKPKQPVSLPFVLYIQFKSNIIFTANQTDSLINVILVNMDITKV